MKKYVQRFIVSGKFNFPIDMLRYDQTMPASENDSHLISGTYSPEKIETVRIHLKRFIESNGDYPTVDRWKSFLWTVDEASVRTEKI